MMKKILMLVVVVMMALSCVSCGKSDAAKNADEKIKAIGKVALESGNLIITAEKTVEALAEEDKNQVDKLEELKKARETYDELLYTDEAKKAVEAIDKIKEVSLENVSIITDARNEYKKLSSKVKEKVTNYQKLLDAEAQIKPLKKEKANEALSKLRVEEDKVRNLKFYYPTSMPYGAGATWYADVRCFVLPYIGTENDSAWLRLIYNYTGDDWVFFKRALFNIDGEQTSRTFKYFDIVHDNDGGVVWEYIDIEGDSEVELLKKIANSSETIIRFQGDDYSQDFTVTQKDKDSIREMVEIFELMN